MKDTLQSGLTTTRRFTVDTARTIDFLPSDGDDGSDGARVYATPAMIGDIETTCRDFLGTHLDDGEDSLGTSVDIKHLAPTLLGMWAEITVNISAVEGRAIAFDVSAVDAAGDKIASGRHDRFVIDVSQTLARLKKKADAFTGG